ncbi:MULTISPECIES: hypothetical protein [Acetobacteraceae]|uniref:DUF4412 domain-containing protein n=2 Tax=Parasaccharibacter apium TaxID=1510841 RepID=A0A7U7J1R9_9PROT|nr:MULTISPECIES: hypothetical protein [Acetobacteraceae]MCT6820092.1 hypothetical protein [Bombella apis]MUH02318.1 hypothetical protein [Bombella sp. ESL0387]CDG34341.1 hypothetical protein SACS_1603 [Parasaccharibacter apium]
MLLPVCRLGGVRRRSWMEMEEDVRMQWCIREVMPGRDKVVRRAGGTVLAALGAAVLACGIAEAAAPADHPPLAPMRDAVVTYRFQTEVLPGKGKEAGPEHQVAVSFAASGDRLRIDPDDGQSATILDRPNQIMTLVSMQERRYIQFRPMHGLHNTFLLSLDMTYHAGGMKQIAGVPCREWAIESPRGKATACVTEDGLILAEDGVDADGLQGHLQAVSVRYEDIPADRFQPPAGFQRVSPFLKGRPASQPAQARPVPDAPLDGTAHGAARTGGEGSSVPDQPHSPDDSVGDGSVSHGDQPNSAEQ